MHTYQFTNSLSVFSAAMRTFLLAGFALNIIFSPLKGLMPSRALVAGFFTTFIFRRPGKVNRPWLRRLFFIVAESESNTAPTCFLESSVSFEMVARISDLVGAAFFFAILNLLLMFANADSNCPTRELKFAQFQLGAENNIEKSRCLAQTKKNILSGDAIRTGFSVFPCRPAPDSIATSCF